jgi:hypothetical protein
MRRDWTVPTDRFGPATRPTLRLSRRGLGARLVYQGNPVSFTADVLGPCVPFLSLSGGRDRASDAARGLGNFDNEGFSQEFGDGTAQTGERAVSFGSRSDLNGGQPFALWASRKTLPGI